MKALRVVNWQPIRKPSRWEGSVWQQVHNRMQEDGFEPLSESELTKAFMKKVDTPLIPKKKKVCAQRALPARTALAADLLHAQLVRKGITSPRQLQWATGFSRCHDQLAHAGEKLPGQAESPQKSTLPDQSLPLRGASGEESGWEDEEEISGDLLELVLGLLSMGSAASHQLHKKGHRDAAALALSLPPSEEFLSRLMSEAGPLQDLQPRVEMALHIARFPSEAADLAEELKLGIDAAAAVLGSSVLPMLLEGILLLGNYINASSKTLGGVVGITLDSLAKLAHTRCLPDSSIASEPKRPHHGEPADQRCHTPVQARRPSSRHTKPQQPDNALHLLVRQLQGRRSHFARQLTVDLELCSKARDLDPQAMTAAVNKLVARVHAVEHHVEGILPLRQVASGRQEPKALKPERLRSFLDIALPKIRQLQELADELHSKGAALRRYFAEPDDSSLTGIFQCLAALLEALPRASAGHKVQQSADVCHLQRCLPSKDCLVTAQQQRQQQQQQQEQQPPGSKGATSALLSPLRDAACLPISVSPSCSVPPPAAPTTTVVADAPQTPPRRTARALASPPPLPCCDDTVQNDQQKPAAIIGSETMKPWLHSIPRHKTSNAPPAPVALPPASASGRPTTGKTQDAATPRGVEFGLQVDAALRI